MHKGDKNMNLVDVLLSTDVNKVLAEETKTYEIARLSNVLGTKFELTLKPIPFKKYSEIQTTAIKMNGKKREVDLYKMQLLTLSEGIKSPNLADPKLLKKFGAITPFDMYEKLFLAGEITNIADEIGKLSGYDIDEKEKNVEEVKN